MNERRDVTFGQDDEGREMTCTAYIKNGKWAVTSGSHAFWANCPILVRDGRLSAKNYDVRGVGMGIHTEVYLNA